MKPTGVSLAAALGIPPTYFVFKLCPWMEDLAPAQQSGITMGITMAVAGALALGARVVAEVSLWARDVLATEDSKTDVRALCLRLLAQLHGG